MHQGKCSAMQALCLYILLLTKCASSWNIVPTLSFDRVSATNCRPSIATQLDSYAARSLVECCGKCLNHRTCSSVAFHAESAACLLYDSTFSEDTCLHTEGWESWNADSCQNGGYFLPDGSCRCVNGYLGDRCQRLMEDCAEGKASPHYPNIGSGDQRKLWARPRQSPEDVQVTCRKNGNTIFLQKSAMNSYGSFNKSWAHYVDGLRIDGLEDDFWMGLKSLYYFTNSKNYKLHLRIVGYGTTRVSVTYNSIRVLDNFTFSLGLGEFDSSSGDAMYDLLSTSNGQRFSTFDNDNDGDDARNCAAEYEGGWWYNGCPNYNLMGWVAGEEETPDPDKQYLYYGPLAAGIIQFLTLSLEL